MNVTAKISKWLFEDAEFMRWENPGVLWLLILVVLYPILIYFQRKKVLKNLYQIISPQNTITRFPSLSKKLLFWRTTLVSLGILFLVVSGANLQVGGEKQKVEKEGIDIVFCLDISKSMLAEDIIPNRLLRAKNSIQKVVDNLGSDRVGIVVFSGLAYLQLPLTTDHTAIEMYLQNISTEIISVGGTNFSAALEKSLQAFPKKSITKKVIILISDGENHDEEALQIADKIKEEGIVIYAVGIGSQKGVMIPEFINGKKVGWKKDKHGSAVVSRLNEEILQKISESTGGKYVQASNQGLGLDLIMNDIQNIEKTKTEAAEYLYYKSYFSYFLVLALILLGLEFILFERKWIK
jgi:Ca-activated chloride channel family protein